MPTDPPVSPPAGRAVAWWRACRKELRSRNILVLHSAPVAFVPLRKPEKILAPLLDGLSEAEIAALLCVPPDMFRAECDRRGNACLAAAFLLDEILADGVLSPVSFLVRFVYPVPGGNYCPGTICASSLAQAASLILDMARRGQDGEREGDYE